MKADNVKRCQNDQNERCKADCIEFPIYCMVHLQTCGYFKLV